MSALLFLLSLVLSVSVTRFYFVPSSFSYRNNCTSWYVSINVFAFLSYLFLFLPLYSCLPVSLTVSTLTHTLTHSHSQTLTLTHTHTHSRARTFTHSHKHSHTHSYSHSLSLTHSLLPTHNNAVTHHQQHNSDCERDSTLRWVLLRARLCKACIISSGFSLINGFRWSIVDSVGSLQGPEVGICNIFLVKLFQPQLYVQLLSSTECSIQTATSEQPRITTQK
jgi:hypothetical protein